MDILKYIYSINYYTYLVSPVINIFSYKKDYNINDIKDTVEKMNNIKINVINRTIGLENKIIDYNNNAIKFYKIKNNYLAFNNLKLKKIYENEKKKLDSIIFNIETYIFQIESFGLMLETAETLKTTSCQLTSLNKKLNINKIEDIIEDLNENREIGHELQNIFTDNININVDYDESELLKELQDLDSDNINNLNYNKELENKELENKELENKELENKELENNLPKVPFSNILFNKTKEIIIS